MNGEKGFTYPAALMLVIIVSVSLMVVHQQWSTVVKRDKETELFFRADQIVDAIASYYENSPGATKQYPQDFKSLLSDPRFPSPKRHLRKLYKDPIMSDGEWGVVYDGKGRIKGVYSRSDAVPLKTGGFEKKYAGFQGKKAYSGWKFVYEPKKETSS